MIEISLDAGPYQRAVRTDQHDLVVVGNLQRADSTAVALRGLDRDDALPAAALHREIVDRRSFAVAVLGRGQDQAFADDASAR